MKTSYAAVLCILCCIAANLLAARYKKEKTASLRFGAMLAMAGTLASMIYIASGYL